MARCLRIRGLLERLPSGDRGVVRGLLAEARRERRRLAEVHREAAGALVGVRAVALLQRLADLAVQAHAARRRELGEQRLLHLRVREAVAPGLLRLLDHARLERLLDQLQQRVLVAVAEQRQRVVGEVAADDRGDLQQLVRLLATGG